MYTTILVALLTLAPLIADAGGPARCTTKWDAGLERYLSECSDNSRAITRWDAGFQRWHTDVVREPKGDKPRGWPTPGKAPR